MSEAWTPPEAPRTPPEAAHRSDIVALVAAFAALVLFVGAFAYVAHRNDGDAVVTATAPDDADEVKESDEDSTAVAGIVAQEHAHDDGDHAHEDDAHAHDDATSHAHPPATAQPASAQSTPQCAGSSTTTTTTTTTTAAPHTDDGHHHDSPTTTTTTTTPVCDPPTTTTTTTAPGVGAQATTTTTHGEHSHETPTTTPNDTTPATHDPNDHHHPPVIVVPPPPGQTTTTTIHDHHSAWPGEDMQMDDLWADYPVVAYQIYGITKWALQYPKASQATAAGFPKLTKYFPGIAAHYINVGRLYDNQPFDPMKPEVLLYDGDGPDANLVGINYIVKSGAEPPEGFEGDWDQWHEHKSLCLKNGLVVAEAPSPICSQPGVTVLDFSGFWLLHVWSIPGFEAPEGLFSHENSLLQ